MRLKNILILQEAREKGLAPYYQVTTDEEGIVKSSAPWKEFRIVTVFLIVVLIFGGVVLLFLSVMAIRERKYEIGVLRAIGLKRGKFILGMVCESLTIAAICLAVESGPPLPSPSPLQLVC